jgi:hypothetical protein
MGLFDNYTGDVLEGLREPQWKIPLEMLTPPPTWTVQACPVCQGRGGVPAGFYGPTNDLSGEVCRGCQGKGMLRVSQVNGSVEPIS